MRERPPRETDEYVYSNFDHNLVGDTVKELQDDSSLYSSHYAWNFCGYIWWDGEQWIEQVWRYRSPVDEYTGQTIEEVIERTNGEYGYG